MLRPDGGDGAEPRLYKDSGVVRGDAAEPRLYRKKELALEEQRSERRQGQGY